MFYRVHRRRFWLRRRLQVTLRRGFRLKDLAGAIFCVFLYRTNVDHCNGLLRMSLLPFHWCFCCRLRGRIRARRPPRISIGCSFYSSCFGLKGNLLNRRHAQRRLRNRFCCLRFLDHLIHLVLCGICAPLWPLRSDGDFHDLPCTKIPFRRHNWLIRLARKDGLITLFAQGASARYSG